MFHLAYRLILHKGLFFEVMTNNDAPKAIGEVIDEVERLREELFIVQRALEKMERALTTGPDAEEKKR
jgi:hypothetical protein